MSDFNLSINELAKAFSVSRTTVLRWIDNFSYGEQYIDLADPKSHLRQLRFNLKACQDYFLTAPEKR